jgi:hypothetical protein
MTQVFACTGMGLRQGPIAHEPSSNGVNATEYYAGTGAKPVNTRASRKTRYRNDHKTGSEGRSKTRIFASDT